jgi:hypothetical protein
MSERWTLFPGDHVAFAGHEWEVFMLPRGEQSGDTPVCIFRPEHPGRATDMIDAVRQRGEMTLIPRMVNPPESSACANPNGPFPPTTTTTTVVLPPTR